MIAVRERGRRECDSGEVCGVILGILTFLTMALKNICSEGYTHRSSVPPLGMEDTCLSFDRGKG